MVHSATIPTNLSYLTDIGTVSLADGGTAITYSGTDNNQIVHPVYYQHLDTNGNVSNTTSTVILNDIGNGQYSATSNVNGGFTLTWETFSTDGSISSNQTLHIQSFNPNGQAISNDIIIEHTDTSLNDIQYTTPSIITLKDDSHLVEYIKKTYDVNTGEQLSTHEIRRYDTDGGLVFTSSTPAESGFDSVHATALADGGWLDIYQGGTGVYEARYDADNHHIVAIGNEDSVLAIDHASYQNNDQGVVFWSITDHLAYDSTGHVVGDVQMDSNQDIIFTPNDSLDALGKDVVENVTFSYTGAGPDGGGNLATVTFDIAGNDDPNSDVFTLNMDQNINFAALDPSTKIFSGVDIIDLNSNGNHSIDNLSLDDVLFMTDADHTLTILGDFQDNVSLATPTNGYSVAQSTEANFNVYTYHSDNAIDPTVVLKIDQDVNVTL
jgi:hypothetical protein